MIGVIASPNQLDKIKKKNVFSVKRTFVKTLSLLPESEEIERLPLKQLEKLLRKQFFLLSVPLGKLPFLSVFAFSETIYVKF